MTAFWSAIVNSAILSALLTIAVWIALRLTPRIALNAATRYAIWWLVLLATLALPLSSVQWPQRAAAADLGTGNPADRIWTSDFGCSAGSRSARGTAARNPRQPLAASSILRMDRRDAAPPGPSSAELRKRCIPLNEPPEPSTRHQNCAREPASRCPKKSLSRWRLAPSDRPYSSRRSSSPR